MIGLRKVAIVGGKRVCVREHGVYRVMNRDIWGGQPG